VQLLTNGRPMTRGPGEQEDWRTGESENQRTRDEPPVSSVLALLTGSPMIVTCSVCEKNVGCFKAEAARIGNLRSCIIIG